MCRSHIYLHDGTERTLAPIDCSSGLEGGRTNAGEEPWILHQGSRTKRQFQVRSRLRDNGGRVDWPWQDCAHLGLVEGDYDEACEALGLAVLMKDGLNETIVLSG